MQPLRAVVLPFVLMLSLASRSGAAAAPAT
jgi:hypothetical protein